MNVRRAKEEEIDYLVDMFSRMYRLNSEFDPLLQVPDNLEEKIQKILKEDFKKDNVILAVAEENGKVIGSARVVIANRDFYIPEKVGIIQEIYVYPAYRRRNVGEKLLDYLYSELKKNDISVILALFPSKNIISTSFYTKKGFRELHNEFIRQI
ncbi:GNAT family N-acetyltransferase [Acidianus brierleyi]|uniref:N-acetyltransferase n=1 Tax=Acidianus brierleyi TaxID=41673 RepID=A0A2U9IIE6_9CREN|nr:GNAT family N-acetyltransferase [Acidianus brierleyi]AWR95803.1 GNAT family N-acetyltransferase [Acidianus brierleyi]